MLEGLAAWVLNNYLGKYVENLNTDQLSIAMLSGKVELENLPLKKDALRHLGLPIEVKAGFIGKVQLQVPVRQLRTAPWVIVIEKLYLLTTPVNLNEWDPNIEALITQERKMAILDALEAQWRAENEAHLNSSYYASSYSSWLSYGTGFLTNIVENLQLQLKDVHIRYEDSLTCDTAFSCGLTVESLTAESCNASWQPGYTNYGEGDNCSFKLMELQNLAVYWDPVPLPVGLLANYTLNELAIRMSQTWRSNHIYILSPSTAVAQLKHERTEQPLRSKTRPRISCNLTLDQVVLNLTNRQYNQCISCQRGLTTITRLRKYREFRPVSSVQSEPRAWWTYAVRCHFPDATWMDPKPTWDTCLEQAKKACEYVDICLYTLTNPAATLPMDKKTIKDEFEWGNPLEILKPLREIAMRKVPKSVPAPPAEDSNTAGRSMLVQWFPLWWGWYGNSNQLTLEQMQCLEDSTDQKQQTSSRNFEEEILDALADSIENNTLLKRDTVFGHFDFILNRGSLNLCIVTEKEGDENNIRSMLELQFEKVSLGIESRPRTSSHLFSVTLGTVALRDKITSDTLFPVLIAPQGTIREGLSGMNVTASMMSRYRSQQASSPPPLTPNDEPLFHLVYEKKPFNSTSDYKLFVKSQSLEVVYNSNSVKWLSEFISYPFNNEGTMSPLQIAGAYARMRNTTKMHLINQWEHLLKGHSADRNTWQIELDISAPQILFVEDFTDKNGTVLVIDFGKMQLSNDCDNNQMEVNNVDEDDEEMFMTPCSTPPGSILSPGSPLPFDTPQPATNQSTLDSQSFHKRLYDRYKVDFSDLQILVGRARDNWKYAHNKGTSSLHLLDRFSISLQAERRVVQTNDPQYPSALVSGTLPTLVVHLSEQKVAAVKSLFAGIAAASPTADTPKEDQGLQTPVEESTSEFTETERSASNNLSKLFVLQFAIDQMSLEVQSRGRSIAEVQVCGVKAAFTRRPLDYSVALSVHSLLLVDALQTYGADFELLVASHKHVGMDAASGSIRDSEPTSPTSPTSPASPVGLASQMSSLQPATLVNALSHLPTLSLDRALSPVAGWDAEALIAVELTVVKSTSEELRIANIVFNNLDIIANQETIVELIGFTQRVIATRTQPSKKVSSEVKLKEDEPPTTASLLSLTQPIEEDRLEIRTEITFDFHRLSFLLLRAAVQDIDVVAKKIATITLSEAKIQATIGSCGMSWSGSLGGVQAVSLCGGGGPHSRVLSVGRMRSHPITTVTAAPPAFSFQAHRKISDSDVLVSVSIHMASVWYTHCGRLLGEFASCVREFQQYLANLGRSIRAAATDMAIGLVQPRPESLYCNTKHAQSLDGSSGLRTRTTSLGYSLDNDSVVDFLKSENIVLSVNIQMDTPVVVLPRSTGSNEVFVAHLGNIYINNVDDSNYNYSLQVRDINLYSLNISSRLNASDENLQVIYNPGNDGKPVLHNTTLQLSIQYSDELCEPSMQISGKIVTPLRVSATRDQYEQLLETLKGIPITPIHEDDIQNRNMTEMVDTTDNAGVTTLRMDPHIRARVLTIQPPNKLKNDSFIQLKVDFKLPSFTVELRADFGSGEKSMVDLSFRDFNVNYERHDRFETFIEVSLHSITMEDLTKDADSKHRLMMVSHTPQTPKAVFLSKSCPNLLSNYQLNDLASLKTILQCRANRNSMPNYLNIVDGHLSKNLGKKRAQTPPSSPFNEKIVYEEEGDKGKDSDDNLVLISVQLIDPEHPLFEEKFKKVTRKTKVDFNCLNLILSVDSWVAVLDFFGFVSDDVNSSNDPQESFNASDEQDSGNNVSEWSDNNATETEVSIRRLSIVMAGDTVEAGDTCRAAVCGVKITSTGGKGKQITARLTALALLQPTALWRARFLTSAQTALNFTYTRLSPEEVAIEGYDTTLNIEMSSIRYVHTKRFVAEIQAFFRHFSKLQNVLAEARKKVSVSARSSRVNRMRLYLECKSPVIILPVSSTSQSAIVLDLERLVIQNTFKQAGSSGTISILRDSNHPAREMLDVRTITCENMDLYCGERCEGTKKHGIQLESGIYIAKKGPSLLKQNCHLTLQMEVNTDIQHNVPDMSIRGTLDTLECSLDGPQYSTVRGVLAHNLGEDVEYLMPTEHVGLHPDVHSQVWTLSSIHLELLNVIVRLELEHGVSSLACINFIKSRLLIESYSDYTQDIDLVSQEIQVSDTRFHLEPANKRSNVFTNIVQPISDSTHHSVQAEFHARKRRDTSAYTILVNNMRLMAILDWWDAVNKFIMRPPESSNAVVCEVKQKPSVYKRTPSDESQFELKLNITESQIVLVEDTSLWDTNAVILKSTTVISYRPGAECKPLSCVLNHCEVFSCVIGMEDDTALSIIDPVTLHIDLDSNNVLQFQVAIFNIRLSYHDMRMFASILQSIPSQARPTSTGDSPTANASYSTASVRRLCTLGFTEYDCYKALRKCAGCEDDAAIWLTTHCIPTNSGHLHREQFTTSWPITALKLNADCITLCVIDDCLDSDVPLLEFSFSELTVSQDFRESSEPFGEPLLLETPKSPPLCNTTPSVEFSPEMIERRTGPGGGKLKCMFSGDYYNRALSGWEPVIEPWRCEASWEYTLTSMLSRNRLQLDIHSKEILNINFTSTLIDLYSLVKTNWTHDYYSTHKVDSSPKSSPLGYRRRSPFVPFALNNQTGHKLWFTTIVTTSDVECSERLPSPDDGWWSVESGETEAFSFGSRRRRGASRRHTLRLHALAARVHGYTVVGPVCVDKVGLFFRYATHLKTGVETRIVFAVTLEGSARKLVTVRSALQLVNELPHPVEVKFETGEHRNSGGVRVEPGGRCSASLCARPGVVWVRALSPHSRHICLYAERPIQWQLTELQNIHYHCRSADSSTYRFCCIVRRDNFPPDRGEPMPAHTLTLKPPLRLVNLLPVDLQYCVEKCTNGTVSAGCTQPFHEVDVENPIEMWFKMDGFTNSTILTVLPSANSSFSTKVKLVDVKGRRLYLNAYISIKRNDTIRILISSPYWIINRTGVPLVFRQEGTSSETAGQYEEHEIARMVAPLLFSFTHSEGSPTIVARVGNTVSGQSQWCSPLGLGVGCAVRRLSVKNGERVLEVGISVRAGRGRYRRTNMAVVAPRYQLHNNTSYKLQFAQKCYATTINDPSASSSHVSSVAGCSMPFHWPRSDRDRLLCVRPIDTEGVAWSGAFPIDCDASLHVSCRDSNGGYFFIRIEVVLQGATYFVVFTDADTVPPPIRLKNLSPVPISFHQLGCKDECTVKAHGAQSWALSEPCGQPTLSLTAPGATRTHIALNKLNHTQTLLYQNFIYITLGTNGLSQCSSSALDDAQLVFEVQPGSTKVILGRKRYGDRSQLWRRGPNSQLIHEGSSPPQATNQGGGEEVAISPHSMVLDIEESGVQPGRASGLWLRRADGRRVSTQSWRVHSGRMCCAHANLCVQPLGGLFGLRPGNRVVLGLMYMGREGGIPQEQQCSWQMLRPGSGFLNVTIQADGPTRLITIVDAKAPEKGWVDDDIGNTNTETLSKNSEFELKMALGGLGVSLISKIPAEELVYAIFSGILMELNNSSQSKSLNLSVQDIQWDNQLLGSPCPVLLYMVKNRSGHSSGVLPALQISMDLTPSPPNRKYNAVIFKHLIVSLSPVAIKLEERLILKLCSWGGLGQEDNSNEDLDETDFETQRLLNEVTAVHAKRYYFGVLKIVPSLIRLSMQTTSKLTPELILIKRHLNLTLIKFEDANVELEPFVRWHPFETGQFLIHSILKHFKKELKWQAAKILGSVDFLGNPLGFMQDVSEGVSEFIYDFNVGALFKNVTHGLSNSAAKVTESLGDGLERVIVDEAHEETRRRIRSQRVGTASHLAAGFRGLGLGLLGGATSLVKHSYEGFSQEGLPGLLSGVGKGLVGTVTKPVIGVLDLATETASALRESSRRSDKLVVERMRPSRCCAGADGLLPRYSRLQSVGHHYLYTINNNDYSESFLAYLIIRDTPHDIRALISDRYLRIFTCKSETPQTVMETHLSNLVSCNAVSTGGGQYVELVVRGGISVTSGTGEAVRKPRVQCDSAELAAALARHARCATRIYYDRAHTLPTDT